MTLWEAVKAEAALGELDQWADADRFDALDSALYVVQNPGNYTPDAVTLSACLVREVGDNGWTKAADSLARAVRAMYDSRIWYLNLEDQ